MFEILLPFVTLFADKFADVWLRNHENQQVFAQDIAAFLMRQQQHTHLDIFRFANRPAVKNQQQYLFLNDVYIPMRLNSKSRPMPNFQTFNERSVVPLDNISLPDELNIVELINSIGAGWENNGALIIGSGGSGKSTFLKYLAHFFTNKFTKDTNKGIKVLKKNRKDEYEMEHQSLDTQYIPIFIRLRDLETELLKYKQKDWVINYTFAKFLATHYGLDAQTDRFYAHLLRNMPCLLLIDGIDEVPEHKQTKHFELSRTQVMQWLVQRSTELRKLNPQSSCILTSRPTDTVLLARHFYICHIKPFIKPEINFFVDYWYNAYKQTLEYDSQTDTQRDYTKKIAELPNSKKSFLAGINHPNLEALLSNPLLLSLAILIHSIDNTFKVDDIENLYQRFLDTLLYQWDEVRDMDFYTHLFPNNSFKNMQLLLRRLAHYFSVKQTTILPYSAFKEQTESIISRFNGLPPNDIAHLAQTLLEALRDRSGILTGSQVYDSLLDTEFEFQHKTLQDYLTAQTLKEDGLLQNQEFSLTDKVGDAFWDKTIEFYVKIANPDYFFTQYIDALAPDTSLAKNLPHFGQYFLMASDKSPHLAPQLALKCADIVIRTTDATEVVRATMLLSRLQTPLPDTLCAYWQKSINTPLMAFKHSQILFLYYQTNNYAQLRQTLWQKIALATETNHHFVFACYALPICLLAKDTRYLLLMEQLPANAPNSYVALKLLYLLNLQQLPNLLRLLDLKQLLYFPSLGNFKLLRKMGDLRNLQDLRDLRYLRYLRDLQDLQDLRDLRDFQDLPSMEYKISHLPDAQLAEIERVTSNIHQQIVRVLGNNKALLANWLPV